MPTYGFWILLGIWGVVISIIAWILIDIKRYPWKYGAKEK